MREIVQQGMEKITLVDAVGNRITIPTQLCPTYKVRLGNYYFIEDTHGIQMLTDIIRVYFENQQPPGTRLVQRGHYQLISGNQNDVVKSSAWTFIVGAGLTIEMSMIRHDHRNRMDCPRCGHASMGWEKSEWETWYDHLAKSRLYSYHFSVSCEARFQITDPPEDSVVSPGVSVSLFKKNFRGKLNLRPDNKLNVIVKQILPETWRQRPIVLSCKMRMMNG